MPPKKKVTEEVEEYVDEFGVDDVEDVHTAAVYPEPPVAPPPATMDDAFRVLCKAVLNSLEDLPDLANVVEIQKRYADGHVNLAWQQIWTMAQGILGI